MSALILFVGGALFKGPGLVIGLVIALGINGYSYFNSDKLALKAMHARPVSEAEQPAMYRIVRELSTEARQPMPRLYVSPTQRRTPSPPAATRATRRSAAPTASCRSWTSASCGVSLVTSSCTSTTATF